MSHDQGLVPHLRRQLDHVISQCLAAIRAGIPPDREALLARYPALANHLRTFFAAQDAQTLGEAPDAPTPSVSDQESERPPGEAATLGGAPAAAFASTIPAGQSPTADNSGPAPAADGEHFGDYLLLEPIARGGMGVVFKARQVSLNRIVALKMILVGQFATEADVQRFRAEAEAAANLDHPGIVPIHEVGQHLGQHYYCMGFVEGSSLARRMAKGPLPPREAAELIRKVAEAIDYAHKRGVVHRDLKPGNILLDAEGQPRVTDFGLAKRIERDSDLTATGQILGTPSYMPPEQAAGKTDEIGPLADVYALGATLYALITGRAPFQAANLVDTLRQVLEQDPVPPRQLNPDVPLDIETICLKCLEKDRHRRYASARELAEELARFLNGEAIHARPVGPLELGWRWARRHPARAGLLVASVVALISSVVVVVGLGYQRQLETANSQLAEAKDSLDELLYLRRVALAFSAWKEHDIVRARELLAECPEARRDWEWHYVDRLCHAELLTLTDFDTTNAIFGLATSPDGKRIAGVTAGGPVSVRDAESGQEIATFTGHSGGVFAIAFSPDGQRIASAGEDKLIRVWNADSGREVLRLEGHTKPVAFVAFSPDGKRIASASPDEKRIKVWDVETGREVFALEDHALYFVPWLTFSPDGHQLASWASAGGFKTAIKVWDLRSRQESFTIGQGNGFPAFSPDGKRIASGNADGLVEVRNAATGKVELTLPGHTDRAVIVVFSPDGKWIASASYDNTLRIWDAISGKASFTLRDNVALSAVAFDAQSTRLVTASESGPLTVWDARTGRRLFNLLGHADTRRTDTVTRVSFSPDGKRLTSASGKGTVKVWNVQTSPEVTIINDHRPQAAKRAIVTFRAPSPDGKWLAFSPDGARLITAEGAAVKVWDVENGNEVFTLQGGKANGNFWSVAFSPDGTRIAGTGNAGTVTLWDAENGHETLLLGEESRWGNMAPSVCFSPDGKWLASTAEGEGEKSVRVWDARSGERVRILRGSNRLGSVTFSPDSERIAACEGNKVIVWSANTGQEVLALQGDDEERFSITSLAFSRDGQRLAAAGGRLAKVWDAATGEELLTLKGHTDDVVSLAFNPDGTRIATASRDQTVKIWDAVRGQEAFTLKGHTDFQSVTFSPDGKRLACRDQDGAIWVWEARPMRAALP